MKRKERNQMATLTVLAALLINSVEKKKRKTLRYSTFLSNIEKRKRKESNLRTKNSKLQMSDKKE